MRVNIVKPSLYVASFITFIGYYVVVLLVLYFGTEQVSRLFTVPTRLLAAMLMLLIIFKKGFDKSYKSTPRLIFAVFSFIYLGNVVIDFIFGGQAFASRSSTDMFMYYFIYALVPFYFFSQKKRELDYELIFKALVLSGIILSLASLIAYKDILIGGYSRISLARYDVSFELISPLSLSYASSLLIGVCISGILFNKNLDVNIKYLLFGIAVGIGPFLLGASRGSLLSLILPFIFVLLLQNGVKAKISILITVIIFGIIVYWMADSVGSGIFNRFIATDEGIQMNTSSAIRLMFWEAGLQQFSSAPVFGDSIHFRLSNYPHNLIIESLMATGVVGTIPLLILLVIMVRKSVFIINYSYNYIWVVVAFWQGFISSMFSYAIYNNIIFYATLGLLVSVSIKKKE